jgi:hypothetical protein
VALTDAAIVAMLRCLASTPRGYCSLKQTMAGAWRAGAEMRREADRQREAEAFFWYVIATLINIVEAGQQGAAADDRPQAGDCG